MRRVFVWFFLSVVFLTLGLSAEAQQPARIHRIGILSGSSGSSESFFSARVEAFRQRLRELDYIEGQNITIEIRNADGKFDRLPALATELVRLKVDVIVTIGNRATRDAKGATTTIPIVMMLVQQPVSFGVVGSLARPGANVTGFTTDVTPEQAGKNLEILKEVVPKGSRVAIPRRTNVSTHIAYSKESERAAKILGITVQFAEVQAPSDKHLEEAFAAIVHKHADALLIPPSGFLASRRQQIVDFAARNNLPAIYPVDVYVEKGGLMSYGPKILDQWRRAAIYVDKILKGTKPGDLPVERPSKFVFAINLKTTRALGLKIPAHLLMAADKVIE